MIIILPRSRHHCTRRTRRTGTVHLAYGPENHVRTLNTAQRALNVVHNTQWCRALACVCSQQTKSKTPAKDPARHTRARISTRRWWYYYVTLCSTTCSHGKGQSAHTAIISRRYSIGKQYAVTAHITRVSQLDATCGRAGGVCVCVCTERLQ